MEVVAELALDKKGRFLATRFTGYGNMGAYLTPVGPMMTTLNIAKNSIGMYRTPLVEVNTICAVTNTVPIGAYRGAGRPEGNYYMERLIDDRCRARWASTASSCAGATMVTPDRAALGDAGRHGLRQRRLPGPARPGARSRRLERLRGAAQGEPRGTGKLRGRGIGCYLEVTAPPSNEMGGIHFEADGTVTIVTGTLDYGQGHWTPFAQVLTSKLGVPFDKIRLVQGDSDRLIAGGGTGGSKSIMASGAAIIEASALVIEKGQADRRARPGGRQSRTSSSPRGASRIAGTDRSIGIMELAQRLRDGAAASARPAADRSTSTTSSSARRRPIRTAATSPRSRSTRRPASPRSCATSWSTTSARS